MNPLAKYLLFVVVLLAVVGIAANPELFYASALSGDATVSRNRAGAIPSIAPTPSQALAGVRSTGAIDYRSSGALTATSSGALNLGSGTVGGTLDAASNNGAISQTGPLTVTGERKIDA